MRTNRREFLRISSVAAVGLAVAAYESELFGAAAADVLPLLSVGYAPSLPGEGASVRLSEASRLLMPDVGFLARSARVSVRGSRRSDKYITSKTGLSIDAVFPAYGVTPDQYPRFMMWCARLDSTSGPTSFTMPAEATTGLSFVIQRGTATSKLTLSLGSSTGPKLQRGVYVISLRETSNDKEPDWKKLDLTCSNRRLSIPGIAVDYVILQVDYA